MTLSNGTVLVVDDEENILEAIKYTLVKEGYKVLTANDGEAAIQVAREKSPDLMILDLMIPKIDGLAVCNILRLEMSMPILMLTAKVEETDKVIGLELGADDYVTKPFSMRELVARVKALLRRSGLVIKDTADLSKTEEIITGNLILNLLRHEAKMNNEVINLKPQEFSLLHLLASNKGRAFSRTQLLDQLWEADYIGDIRTVDVHIRWLREKIETDPSKPRRIVTVRGIGYRFEE